MSLNYTKYLTLGCAILLMSGCGGGGGETSSASETPLIDSTQTVVSTLQRSYDVNNSQNLLNPQRGFYTNVDPLNVTTTYNRFTYAQDQGYEVVYAPIDLQDYVYEDQLPQSVLDTIAANLKDAQESKIGLIVRIVYRKSGGEDPLKSRILEHIAQLKSIFSPYLDVVNVVQIGSIGEYGEWHSFTGEFNESDPNYKANRKAVVDALADTFSGKFLQIRTPMHKEFLYGSSTQMNEEASSAMITPQIAYTSDIKARLGHHNDCFLDSAYDGGTYPTDNVEFWKGYVQNDARYTPLGGETCYDNTSYTECGVAQQELRAMGWTYLNSKYHPDVIDRWKQEGCYDTIAYSLGYNFVASDFSAQQTQEDMLYIKLNMKNDGYAPVYEPYKVDFILHNTQQNYIFEDHDIDLRTVSAGSTFTIAFDINTSQVVDGNYTLSLKITTPSQRAIHLSNVGMWESDLQANKLFDTIEITH